MDDPTSAYTILLVDDDANIANILTYGLKGKGYIVHTAYSAQQALQISTREHIDCLFTDLRLPDEDGLSLKTVLYKKNPHLKTILMTGYPGIKSVVKGLRENVSDYLIKPFTLEQAVSAIEKIREINLIESQNASRKERIIELENELLILQSRLNKYEKAGTPQGSSLRQRSETAHETARRSYQQQSSTELKS